jgi:hypothetical protein
VGGEVGQQSSYGGGQALLNSLGTAGA